MKLILFTLLGFVGLGLVSYQFVLNHFISPTQLNNAYSQSYDELSSSDIEENIKKLKDDSSLFDFDEIESMDIVPVNPKIKKESIVGSVYVPSVDMQLPILYGATHENMLVAAGTLKAEQEMGKGNYSIASHNAKNPNILFAPIRRIEQGDYMYLTDKRNVYVYRMVEKEVIEPERVDVIEDREGIDELTLVSCYSPDGSDRIFVKGDLYKIVSIHDIDDELKRKLLNMK